MQNTFHGIPRISFLAGVLFLSCSLLGGCGDGVATAPIRGQVTVAGKPVGPGMVVLQPEPSDSGVAIPLTTLTFAADGQFSGRAPIGKHQVIVQSQLGEPGQEVANSKPAAISIPLVYSDPSVSNLTAEVVSGDNELKLDLNPNPRSR